MFRGLEVVVVREGDSDERHDDGSRGCSDFEKGLVIGSGRWTSEGKASGGGDGVEDVQ